MLIDPYVLVLPLQPTDTPYTYKAPDHRPVAPGSYVAIDIRGKKTVGVVAGIAPPPPAGVIIKSIERVFDLPPQPPAHQAFLRWVAQYTLAPLGAVLKLSLSGPQILETPAQKSVYQLGTPGGTITPPRARVLQIFETDDTTYTLKELKSRAGVSDATLRAMVVQNQLLSRPLAIGPPAYQCRTLVLSSDQQAAVDAVSQALDQFRVFLLDGVTGSGKTEVYFTCAAQALAQGKQILILLPEIALTAQTIARFTQFFGAPPAIWHSGISPAQRHRTWHAVARGQARVVIGARSALFLPYAQLGLIVVDEEHDSAYKQEEGLIYNARDMAVARAQIEKTPIILASATPALETYMNAQSGKYQHLKLSARHGGAVVPRNVLIDMRTLKPTRPQRWLSPTLISAIAQTAESGHQSLLFLNRRGYAPLSLCSSCGERMSCPHCAAWLVAHKGKGILLCHHCGFRRMPPPECGSCGAQNALVPCGPGVERIVEELEIILPHLRTCIMDRDNTQTPADLEALLQKVHDRSIDILIGTQMIAKGHHFPHLTLVGVIDADLGLAGGDLRACEKTYQLLHQVAGRAGREEAPGSVYLQTFNPQHPVMQALVNQDRDAFYALEAQNRSAMGLPPYGRLASLIFSGPIEKRVEETAYHFAKAFPGYPDVHLLGPTPAPLSKIRANYRWRMLIQAPRTVNLQAVLRSWLSQAPRDSKTRIQVDIDPCSFL